MSKLRALKLPSMIYYILHYLLIVDCREPIRDLWMLKKFQNGPK